MDREVRVRYWQKGKPKDELCGILEDLKKGDVFYLEDGGNSDNLLIALMDADVKETSVHVPCEDYKNIFEKLFGERETDSEGYMKFSRCEVELFKHGFEISYSAKGFGFGSLTFAFREGEGEEKTLRTDTECTGLKTLTALFRAAAPALAQLALERDPYYRSSHGLGTLAEDDAVRLAAALAAHDKMMAEMDEQVAEHQAQAASLIPESVSSTSASAGSSGSGSSEPQSETPPT